MSSFSSSSTSYNLSTSSESENDFGSRFQFDSPKINLNKTFQSSLASNLSRQTSNNSLRYFKNLKKKKKKSDKLNTRLKYQSSTPVYSLRSLNTKNNLIFDSTNKKSKILKNNGTTYSNSIDLNQKFANAFEVSSDSDFPDVKYLKIISQNKEINTSTITKDSIQSKSSLSTTSNEQFKINSPKNNIKKVKYLESAVSSNFNFSQSSSDSVNFSKTDGRNNELNLNELLSDCSSLSDVLLIRDDHSGINSQFYPTPETSDSFLRMKSKSPKPLPLNFSFKTNNIPSTRNLSNVSLLMPNLTSEENENEPFQFPEDVEMNIQESILNNIQSQARETESILCSPDIVNTSSENNPKKFLDSIEINEELHMLNNECSKINEIESSLCENKLNEPSSMPNSFKSIGISNSPERVCSRCTPSNTLKNGTKNTSQNISKTNVTNKKQNNSKHSREKKTEKISDFLQIKRSKKTRKHHSINSTNETEDIGLEYDIDRDNFMVELPNGAVVPAFLSTLKAKGVKQLCACGITSSEIPLSWSQSFHDVLHLHLYKLRFKGNITDKEIININENGLYYRIVILSENHYNDENIKMSIKNVDDFVSLEYGISKTGIQSYKHSTYFAVLPNSKVIGFLQVEPVQKAYSFTTDELQPSEKAVPAKFGVSKIWVLIKYKGKNIDINLMDTFREKEKLQKGDLAFFLDGCLSIQFIQEYTGNKNILIFNASPA